MAVSFARRQAVYLLVGAVLTVAYLAVVLPLWFQRGWDERGPLSLDAPALSEPLAGGRPLGEVRGACQATEALKSRSSYRNLKIVGGDVRGERYYACYGIKPDGTIWGSAVLDAADLRPVSDVAVLKAGGAWRWIGGVKTATEVALGAVAMPVLIGLYFLYYRRPRPGPPVRPWWASRWVDLVLGLTACLGAAVLWALPGRTVARKVRVSFQFAFGIIALFLVAAYSPVLAYPELLTVTVVGLLTAAVLWGWLGGRSLVRAPGWGQLPAAPALPAPAAQPTPPAQPAPPAQPMPTPSPQLANAPKAPAQAATPEPADAAGFRLVPPAKLPSFAQVGGMASLKTELADTIGTMLAFGAEAAAYGLRFNGILLHGKPGTGKTFIATATAGEYGLNFIKVTTGDLVSKYPGESAANIERAFRFAAANVPCLLFFDEFDSIAQRRDDDPNEENRRTVNQLLTSLEQWRENRELLVMAATNDLDRLDPAAIRAGRFDRTVRVDLPDRPARAAVLRAQLSNRPVAADLDVDAVALRTDGLTPATLGAVVDAAALAAFRASIETGVQVPITTDHLLGALTARGGQDRPTVASHDWTDLVLAADTVAELRQLQRLIVEPERARALGIDPPSGLLLTGPPGTGKTTVAKILAAQSRCSFYPQSAADLTSKWVGESEQRIQRLFQRARDNAPSIIFLDEIDAIAGRRGAEIGSSVRQGMLTQLLTEIDGVTSGSGQRVFVLAATNRPDAVDPALTRGGRLSRTIEIPLPDTDGRRRLLAIHTRRMPLAADVDLTALAERTDEFSGGDIQALAEQAAVHAMMRHDDVTEVAQADFVAAVATLLASKAANRADLINDPLASLNPANWEV